VELANYTGLSQIRWLCESIELTPAAPCKKRGASSAEKKIFGCGWSAVPTNRIQKSILASYFVKSATTDKC
jgi:hypothetical protein